MMASWSGGRRRSLERDLAAFSGFPERIRYLGVSGRMSIPVNRIIAKQIGQRLGYGMNHYY